MFIFLRILIGAIFLVSGIEKAIYPYQNFLYAIEAYALLPSWAERMTAIVFPWLEVIVGLFLVLGLWTRLALLAAIIFFGVFISVVGQALLRGLDISQCGCFGELIHLPVHTVIAIDSLCLLISAILWRYWPKTNRFSLDQFLSL